MHDITSTPPSEQLDEPGARSIFPGLDTIRGSERLDQLGLALAQAQGEMRGATKDAKNAHFNSNYATLDSVVDAVRPLAAHGLALMQWPSVSGQRVIVTTMLLHRSGQWLAGTVEALVAQPTPQQIGSCLTYLRRYATMAVLGIAPADDDDGEAAEAAHRLAVRHEAKPATTAQHESATRPGPAAASAAPPPSSRKADGEGLISPAQAKRLFAISKSAGWSEDALRAFLANRGYGSSKAIEWRHYDGIIRELEAGPPAAEESVPF